MAKQRAKISQDFFTPTTHPSAPAYEEEDIPVTSNRPVVPLPEEKTSKSQNIKSEKSQNNASDKQQVTLYLNSLTLEELAIAQLKLKRFTGKRGHTVSNSAIVEAALQLIFQDLKENGANSLIARYFKEVE